ncbi:MAG: ABC transporter substrate-binding protein [Burkholderiaceae bacterium]|nr:ABC transporter substrate-binding protein [Burkholderiaceae bacterium]
MKLKQIVLLSAITLTSLIGQAATADTFKIGLNVERTGNAASYGGHVIIASQIAVDAINKNGGVNGSPLELVIQDNRTSPEQAVVAVRNLEREGVVAILGPIQTSQARTAFPASNRAKVVSVSPGSGAPGLAAQNRPWAFRNAAIDDLIFSDVVKAFKERHPTARKIALLVDPKDAYNMAFIGKVAPAALEKHGLTIVNKDAALEIPTDANDHSVFVTKLRAMNADAAVLGLVIEQGKTFLHEMNRQKVDMPMLTGIGYVTNSIAEVANDRHIYSGQPFDPNNKTPDVEAFVTEFKARSAKELPGQYTVPLYIDAGAYESIKIIADALKATGAKPDDDLAKSRANIQTYISTLKDYQGLGNTLSIDKDGDAVKPTIVFRTEDRSWKKL